ncbi:hypothetical protein [Nocardia inohanensis]|uniref:hypothetical protein n=1 Tax=Nocardia inohanensis TaxID=209246 RepID=UPI000ADDAB12|nr:hypothetical protein [Nocardia inohanensis]
MSEYWPLIRLLASVAAAIALVLAGLLAFDYDGGPVHPPAGNTPLPYTVAPTPTRHWLDGGN